MPTLTDSRKLTLQDAEKLHQQLANAILELEKKKAQCELRIARIKDAFETETAPIGEDIEDFERELNEYIMAHQEQFEKPRTHKTAFGDFGLRLVSDLDVTNDAKLIRWLRDRGYTDCYEDRTSVVLKAVRKRIEAGERIPYAAINRGVRSRYTVAKALLEEARSAGN